MKTAALIATALILATSPVLAAEKFAPPDLTIEQPKPLRSKAAADKNAASSPLTPAKSQWKGDDADKPAKSFGDLSGPCDGCKFSVTVKQVPYPRDPGFDPVELDPAGLDPAQ